MHVYNTARARVRQRESASGTPVCEKESSTRGDPVSLDIGYRSGREPAAFVVPRERVYLAHCRKDRGIITFPVAAVPARQSRKRNPVQSASKTAARPSL